MSNLRCRRCCRRLQRTHRSCSCSACWPPCPPRRRCGPCLTSSWARPGTVSQGGRPHEERLGRESGEAAGRPETGAATVCACAHSSPTRRPQAPGLCLSGFAWQATGAGFSPTSGGSSPGSSLGIRSVRGAHFPSPRLSSCHFLLGWRCISSSRGVRKGLEPARAPGLWQPGGGTHRGSSGKQLRLGSRMGLETLAVLVLYYCKGSRKLNFSNVGSC